MTLTIGIDIGGTSVRAGVVPDAGTVVDTARAETPRSAAALERCLDRVVQESLSALAEIHWSSVEQERATRALFERDAALG